MQTTNEPASALLALIAKHRGSAMARMVPGLTEVFDALDAYVQAQELRWTAINKNFEGIARVILDRHFGRTDMSTETLAALSRLADNVLQVDPVELAARTVHSHGN